MSWVLGRLDKTYGDNAIYIHLKRNTLDTAKSFQKRWDFGIMKAYRTDILMGFNAINKSNNDKLGVCMDYCNTINTNIELFLRDKTKKMSFSLETAKDDFKKFWGMINAEGNQQKAINEWDVTYNASP